MIPAENPVSTENISITESITQNIKNKIDVSTKSYAVKFSVDYSECDNICIDMHGCLDACEELLEAGELLAALETYIYFLLSIVKLASNCNDSSKQLTYVVLHAYELIEKCTREIAKQERSVRGTALDLIISAADEETFHSWEHWRYDLLKCGICLCGKPGGKKLEKVLDNLQKNVEAEHPSDSEDRENYIVRYLLHRHLFGIKTSREELYEHINIEELRAIAVSDAVKSKDYAEAERLCLEKVKDEAICKYNKNDPKDWNNILYNIYDVTGDTEKRLAQAKKLLLWGNENLWDDIKQIYIKDGVWEEKYRELLEQLKNSNQTSCYRSVLLAENEMERLMDDVRENTQDWLYYCNFLVEIYPDKVYDLCYKIIWDECARGMIRRDYQKAIRNIYQLIAWKGQDKARELINDLKKIYKGKPALRDELEIVERIL